MVIKLFVVYEYARRSKSILVDATPARPQVADRGMTFS